MFSWLVTWTAESLSKFKVGSDGLTAYERIAKHKCGREAFGFCESVIWQMTPDKTDRNKLDSNFRDGIFLGVVWRSGEFIIGTPDGIFKCRTVEPRPNETAYDPRCIEYIKHGYRDYILSGAKTKGATAAFADPDARPAPSIGIAPRQGNEWALRRVYLKPADSEK